MENVFDELSIDEFLLSLNKYDNPGLIKTRLAEFVVSTFDGINYMLKTKIDDKGKLITNKYEKTEFINKILLHCEKSEEYELCAALVEIKEKIEKN